MVASKLDGVPCPAAHDGLPDARCQLFICESNAQILARLQELHDQQERMLGAWRVVCAIGAIVVVMLPALAGFLWQTYITSHDHIVDKTIHAKA